MKKLGDKLIKIAIAVGNILWFLWGIVSAFGGLESIRIMGNGSLLIGFLKIPFCLLGGVQLFRGLCYVFEKDESNIKDSGSSVSYYLFVLYMLSSIAGMIFLAELFFNIK